MRRKRPAKHTVHTKHPRYSISKYLRGEEPIPSTKRPQEDRISEWGYFHHKIIDGRPYRAEYAAFSIRSAVDKVNYLMGFKGKICKVKSLHNKIFDRMEYTIYTRDASLAEIKSAIKKTGGNAFMYDGKSYMWDYKDKLFKVDTHDPRSGERAMERRAGIR